MKQIRSGMKGMKGIEGIEGIKSIVRINIQTEGNLV